MNLCNMQKVMELRYFERTFLPHVYHTVILVELQLISWCRCQCSRILVMCFTIFVGDIMCCCHLAGSVSNEQELLQSQSFLHTENVCQLYVHV